jgi:hypothetical protein
MGQTVTMNFTKRINVPLFVSIFLTLFLLPTLTQGQLSVNITLTAVKCFGGNTGAATASATGGVSPYTYAWGGGQSGATITNLAASTVSVTVTDNSGATKSATAIINQPAQLGATAFGSSQICGIVPDGTASAVPFGGTAPYTYLWSNGSTAAQILHLAQGNYTVTVTDANSCTTTAATQIFFWNEGIWVMASANNVTCSGLNNGSSHVSVMSGTAPYSYTWSNGQNGADISNLAPGTYSVTVADGNGCSNSTTVNITQPTVLTATATSTNASCNTNTGTTNLTISGGTSPYTVLWNNGSTNTNLTNLGPGTYTATVKDSKNCTVVASSVTIISTNSAITVNTSVVSAATCSTGGSATASVSGGGTLAYLWDNGQTTATATNLTAGNHSVTVTSTTTGCSGVGAVTITQTGGPIASASVTIQATCATGASAAASATGGTAPYTYKWDNNQMTASVTNLSVGNHTVTVTDAGGCTSVAAINIAQPTSPTVTTTVVTNATCATGGSATAAATGGMGSYVYLWDNNQTSATATNLSAGNHTVTVTDAAGCSKVGTVTITGQTTGGPTATAIVTTQATCTTGGSATASAIGGTAPYTYKWDNNQTTAIGTNLSAGAHTVTVTDAGGCTSVATVTIAQPPGGPTLTTAVITNATCTTGGSASVSAGAGTFTYKWDNNQTTATATNLSAGVHTVTVTNAGGCTSVGSVTITQLQGPTVTTTVISNATCSTGGSASASAGAGSFSYKWDNNQTTAIATNLSAGIHTVTVTDAGGCTKTATATITQAPNPTATVVVVTQATCLTGGSATASATSGTVPYTYKWDNNQTTATGTNLSVGAHTVTITDAGGCTATASVTIVGTPTPTATITASANAKCDQAGSATVAATGGTAPYTYKWDNNETTASAINLIAGAHTVTVTDASGCTATASVTIGLTNNGIKIGDYVWFDTDQDGFQDPQETSGVPNISVMLIRAGTDGIFGTADDVTVKSTTTNANGKYTIECVTPGTYILMFGAIPTGYEFTGKDKVNNDCLDSDVNPNGKTMSFTIIAGQTDNLCFDAGIHSLCDNVSSAGQVCCDQTICEGTAPAPLTTLVAAFGGTGTIQYQWLEFLDLGPAGPQWVGINGATAETYAPGILTHTSFFMRCARRAGCIEFLESNIVTITVKAAGTAGCGNFLHNFNVALLSAHTVEVAWATNPEITQYMYYVEHSSDNLTWETVGEVMGHNDANNINQYKLIHDQVSVGQNFYRIKRIDASNLTVVSASIELKMNELALEESVAISPNPVTNTVVIKNMIIYDNDVNVKIATTNGVVLYDLNIPAGSLKNFDLGMDHLPAGIYLARIRFSKSVVKTIKLVKL